MAIANVEKIYNTRVEIKEYKYYSSQLAMQQNVVTIMFDNAKLLSNIIRSVKLASVNEVFGMLSELNPQQKKIFNKAIKRRKFFK